jgi:hypothetical protein
MYNLLIISMLNKIKGFHSSTKIYAPFLPTLPLLHPFPIPSKLKVETTRSEHPMNANRIPGIPSDSNRSAAESRQVQREAAQRIEKVGEVDPDEQARQQRFKQIMQSEESESEEDTSPLPSPFDLSAAKQGDASDEFGMEEIPNSSYSQPPTVSPNLQEAKSDEGLPESGKFWQKTDLPDQPIGKPHFQERTTKKPGVAAKKMGDELSILGPPGKSASTKPESASKKKGTATESPQARYWTPDSSSAESKGGIGERKKTKEPSFAGEEGLGSEEAEETRARQTPYEPVSRTKKQPGEQRNKDDDSKKKEPLQILSPVIPDLPTNIQPAAVSATQAVLAYLRPEITPLFYHMVGSILLMSTPPGISRTEFVLNNPAFANSKFFGATVELIKYSTAPDSYNIRLSGSNEAVAAFNQNIPSLTAAFHAGHFAFRIGRIDAEYSTERTPLVRRKEWDEGERGGQSNQNKGR